MSLLDYKMEKERMGGGGNGSVFRAIDSTQKEVAVKIAHFKKPKVIRSLKDEITTTRLRRFEIEAQKGFELSQNGQHGIIPIIHYELPCQNTGKYFYVMPVATPLENITNNLHDIYELVDIFKQLAQVLLELHTRGISHRDIKPDNILYYNGSYCFSDLGLIDFPEKEDLTRLGETLGNRKTMAPEMRTPKEIEDHRPADVYSFVKTLWMVLAKEEFAFDGQFNFHENHKLNQKYPKQHLVELYELIQDATYENPEKRPTMAKVIERIEHWEHIARDSIRASRSAWQFVERSVIEQISPSTVIWRDGTKVVEILQKLAISNFNHTFLHEGGGMDLLNIEHASWLSEPNMIQLSFGLGTEPHIFKLKRLVWELPNNDPRFSYFRLEFDTLEPIFPDVVKSIEDWKMEEYGDNEVECYENLNINTKGEYVAYNPEDTSEQQMSRWFNGVFLIVHKGSVYNQEIYMTYDGRHAGFNMEEFRGYMEMLQNIYTHPTLSQFFRSIANLNPHEDTNLKEIKELLILNDDEIKQLLEISTDE
ncbi:protein kinase [Paenibacillus sp. OK076]|uniref:protein kinase domain-containing protein n=1 Tax=Paenibacillus sp. OK076 TaxID=1884379 RepID=UPI0008BE61E1|nr:protein kinase [Paenibacillus sp. OK076]SEN67385.1 serine/threonine protein kinase [Paenibacillus sp. OK076]